MFENMQQHLLVYDYTQYFTCWSAHKLINLTHIIIIIIIIIFFL